MAADMVVGRISYHGRYGRHGSRDAVVEAAGTVVVVVDSKPMETATSVLTDFEVAIVTSADTGFDAVVVVDVAVVAAAAVLKSMEIVIVAKLGDQMVIGAPVISFRPRRGGSR